MQIMKRILNIFNLIKTTFTLGPVYVQWWSENIPLKLMSTNNNYTIIFMAVYELEASCSFVVEGALIVRWVIGSISRGGFLMRYFSFQPVLHDWFNKRCGMSNHVCRMMHIKYSLLLIGFSYCLSCLSPYVRCHITVNKMCRVCR